MVGDAELARAAAAGDRTALGDIYDRYADGLYELCRAILHDPHEASDALQDTFVIAATRLAQLRDPERLKPWLAAIARRESIRRSSARARMRPSHDAVLDVPVMDDSAGGAMAHAAAALVWEAANALTERERSLLVLNVRQGLEGADLADAAGLPGPQASVILSRAKTQLASAVRCMVLLRNGRAGCAELAHIVPKAHHALDGLTRKRVARHAQSCAICEPKWHASPDALGVLAAAPLLGAPAALKNNVLNDPRLISSNKPLGAGAWRRDGFPSGDEHNRRRLIASLAAALIFVILATALVLADNDEAPRLAAPDAPDVISTAPSLVADTTLLAGASASSTVIKRTSTTKRAATTTSAKPRVVATTPPTAAAVTTTAAVRVTTSGPQRMTTCLASTFSAQVVGASPSDVFLVYSNSSGGSSTNLPRNGSGYAKDVSILSEGTYSWYVTTSLFGGGTRSDAKTVTVTPC